MLVSQPGLLEVLMTVFSRPLFAVLAVLLLTHCSFVHVEGDGNTVSDTGGDGGGIKFPAKQPVPNDPAQKKSPGSPGGNP
jgi:hypothetical protein